MLRFSPFKRFTTIAARSLVTATRSSLPASSNLLVNSPINTTLSKLKTLQSAWFSQPQWTPLIDPVQKIETPSLSEDLDVDNTLYMDSVLRKRRLKMKKHKLRKRRRLQRSLKKRLGKI